MAEINIVVALGPPSVNMYYLGVGRQVYHNNLPKSLVERIQDGRMANTRLNYINLDKSGSLWCGEEMVGPTGKTGCSHLHPYIKLSRLSSVIPGCYRRAFGTAYSHYRNWWLRYIPRL